MFQFESLIDPAQFGTVRRYLNRPQSPITDVLFVREERFLGPLAELLADEHPTETQRLHFARWVREGRLKVGVQQPRPQSEPGPDCRVDVDSISDQARCGAACSFCRPIIWSV